MKASKKKMVFGCVFLSLFIFNILGFTQDQESYVYTEDFKERAVEYRKLGYQAQQRGDLDTAMSFYQKAVALDPSYAIAYNDIGIIYETRGLIDFAEEHYLRATDIDNKYLPAYTNLAYLYEKKADVLKAAYYWMRRISLGSPGEFWTENARENFRSLSFLSKEVRNIFLKFEAAYLSQQVIDKKISDFQEAVVKSKEYFQKGKELFKQEDYILARQAFESALFLTPGNSDIIEYYQKAKAKEIEQLINEHTSRGVRLYEAGDIKAAQEEFSKILTIIPAQPDQR